MTILTRKERLTGATLLVGTAAEMEVDDEGGKWVVLCEQHSTLVNVDTKADATSTSALDFCDECRDRYREAELGHFSRGYQEALADVLAELQLRGSEAAEEWIRNNRMWAAQSMFKRALRNH